MTEYTQYKLEQRVEFDRSPLEVDGVEIITRKEREAVHAHVNRMMDSIQREIAYTLMYGDGPRPPALK